MTDKELGLTDTEALENMPVSNVVTQLQTEIHISRENNFQIDLLVKELM